MRACLPALLARLMLTGGAAGAQSLSTPAPAPTPAPAGESAQQAYRRGFQDGVDAVNAQLGAVTAKMQQQVQSQINAQLAAIEAQHQAELEQRLAEAQQGALAAQGPASAPDMPRLPPLTVAPGGGIVPRLPDPALPRDPASLPEGTTITVTNPQQLPPQLFRALMDYAAP